MPAPISPISADCSTQMTRSPSCESARHAARPPMPPPTTTTGAEVCKRAAISKKDAGSPHPRGHVRLGLPCLEDPQLAMHRRLVSADEAQGLARRRVVEAHR